MLGDVNGQIADPVNCVIDRSKKIPNTISGYQRGSFFKKFEGTEPVRIKKNKKDNQP